MYQKKSRRYFERQPSSLLVQVRYFQNLQTEITEVSHLKDLARGGARVTLSQAIEMGQPIELTMEMPRLLRAYDKNQKAYTIWGLVRSVACLVQATTGQPGYEIGIAFIGPTPPAGYLDDPRKRYDLKPTPNAEGMWPFRELSAKEREMMANW